MSRGWFVTGTDTGVGKTRIATLLLRELSGRGRRAVGMKPVATGSTRTSAGLRNDDALALLAASATHPAYDDVNPYAFEPSIAPHIAAAEAGTPIDLGRIAAAYGRLASDGSDVVVEGAGGWRVPIGPAMFLSEIPHRLGLDVLLVVGVKLGCLNHARLTAEAIAADRAVLCGWVANQIDPDCARFDENLAALRSLITAPCLGCVPYDPITVQAPSRLLDLDVLLGRSR